VSNELYEYALSRPDRSKWMRDAMTMVMRAEKEARQEQEYKEREAQ
jgi:hypothetical protein